MADHYEPNEDEIKAEFYAEFFYAEFDADYLDLLERKGSQGQSLVELLWIGFAHGYTAGRNSPND